MVPRRRQIEGSILCLASFVLVAQLLPTASGFVVPSVHTKTLTCMTLKTFFSSDGPRVLEKAWHQCPTPTTSRRPAKSRVSSLQSCQKLWSQTSPPSLLFRNTRRKQPRELVGAAPFLASVFQKTWIPLLFGISLIIFPPRQAWAATSSSFLSQVTNNNPLLPTTMIRTAWKIVKISFLAILVIRQWRLRKRQSLDATSEWSRYANYPGTRARALGSLLCLQLFPLWLVTRILQLSGREERAHRMRTRAGNVFADGLLRLG
jgi:hypothetical protein